jgi:hypothetical protein
MRKQQGLYQGPDDAEPQWRTTMGHTTYYVSSEGAGILNPGERPFRSLDRALALAAKAAEECSWRCLTPPAPDNELHVGRGNFRCGVTAAHGIHVRESVDGYWGAEHDVPEEKFRRAKGAGPHVDWTLEVVIDRGTGALADGHDVLFFAGPEQTDTGWGKVVEDIADGDEIVEAIVRPVPQGRYADESGNNGNSYPMTWKAGYGF